MTRWSDRYKHPKWQQKRLRVLERAGWTCESCGDKDTTLHVHHTYYERGKEPWDYDESTLKCLCEPCHSNETKVLAEIQRRIGQYDAGEILGYLHARLVFERKLPAITSEMMEEWGSSGYLLGVASAADLVGIGENWGDAETWFADNTPLTLEKLFGAERPRG